MLATAVALVAIFAADLWLVGRRSAPVGMGEAMRWVAVYVSLALVFAGGLMLAKGAGYGSPFLSGYVTEYSLSFDNLFVFSLIIRRFEVPAIAVDRLLSVGILMSLALRGALIAVGAVALARADWMFYPLGAFLVITAVRLVGARGDDPEDPGESRVIRLAARVVPVQAEYDGRRIAVRHGRRVVLTPLAVVVAAIAVANLVFALDSIPAIFGLTQNGFLVFTANAFAMLGLRQLYFVLDGLLGRLGHLDVGLAAILAFIGAKLILEALADSGLRVWAIGSLTSLLVVIGILAVTVLFSLLRPSRPLDDESPVGIHAQKETSS
ncbi:MAG: TerC/Alx family metal homeostasis membrane protein [Nocardioides sp.]